MPKLDGMELLRRTQGLTPGPHIVLVTAHGSERHAVEAMKLGALDYFRKPFEEQEILGVLRRAIATLSGAGEHPLRLVTGPCRANPLR